MAVTTFTKFTILFALCLTLGTAGINWKAVWLDKPYNPVMLRVGQTQAYKVMGMTGADTTSDLTRSQYLKVVALDPSIIEVDTVNKQFIGKAVGETELRLSFSEAISIVKVSVSKPPVP